MISKNARLALLVLPAAGIALSGCLGPTYGTGTSAGEQLFEDINGMVSFGPSSDRPKIAYPPRPELVRPENTSVLPVPQATATVAVAAPDPTGERVGATQMSSFDPAEPVPASVAAGGDGNFAPSRSDDGLRRVDPSIPLSPDQLKSGSERFRERIKAQYQGDPQRRRYLSEPPVEYRQPAPTAPVGDPGIDEEVKAARLKGGGEGLGAKIRDLLPF